MSTEAILALYLGAVTGISAVMELLVKIDKAVPTWTLSDKVKLWFVETTWARIIAIILSIAGAVIVTFTSGLFWAYIIPGAIAIYFGEFGVGKLGWRKFFDILVTIIKFIFKK